MPQSLGLVIQAGMKATKDPDIDYMLDGMKKKREWNLNDDNTAVDSHSYIFQRNWLYE